MKIIGLSVASAFRIDDDKVIGDRDTISRSDALRKSAKSKSRAKSRYLDNSNDFEKPKFLISKAKKAFNCLKQAFTKAPILRHFDPEYHIRIKTDTLCYIIKKIPSQLIPNQMTSDGTIRSNINWHLVADFFRKMIPAKTWYKTHNGKLLAINEAFKTWWHYLESCKYEVLIFTDYINLCRFINMKSLSSR